MPQAQQPGNESATSASAAQTILVLQGGGALGAYQGGVFQSLSEGGIEPDWVAGVSIGAINAALIAGNPPKLRAQRMAAFWDRITSMSALWPRLVPHAFESWAQAAGASSAALFGQPGFFRPRPPLAWLGTPAPISFYETAPLRATLEELVDFDRINHRAGDPGFAPRLSLGAVEVETGNMVYFDSKLATPDAPITALHVMASGALPPGFPGITIGAHTYWDGGLVSNTPLQYVLAERPRKSSLIFQVDLFPSRGPAPTTLDEVAEREKDIRFSSRTRTGTNDAGHRQEMRGKVRAFLDQLPENLRADPIAAELEAFACAALIDVVQLIYRPDTPQGAQKDVQFDRITRDARWQAGFADASAALNASPWRQPPAPGVVFRSFDHASPPPGPTTHHVGHIR